jgi:hypothetical protein
MARSTGIVLAVGAITMGNSVIVNEQEINWRVPIATGIAAGMLALVEKVSEPLAVGIAYIALITVLFVRVQPNVPAPVESFNNWWNQGR